MNGDNPLISEDSAIYLIRVINRVAVSFDAADLAPEEVIEIWMVLNNMIERLGEAHQETLLPLFHALLDRLGVPPENDDSEDNGGDLH